MNYKAWKVSRFQIFQVLSFIILNILHKRLKIRIIEPYHNFYQIS